MASVVNQVSVGLSAVGDAIGALFGICFSLIRMGLSVAFRLATGLIEIVEAVVSNIEDVVFTTLDVAEKQVDNLIENIFGRTPKKR